MPSWRISVYVFHYPESVTGLLEKALKRVEALSETEQDAIAAQILESPERRGGLGAKFRRESRGVPGSG
jgi:hypothetical protein